MNTEAAIDETSLSVENIGGIEETELTFQPGITVLAGRNATNRTSLLRAIMGALGSDEVTLKADADEGHLELDHRGETYTRTLSRRNGTVVMGGDPYLDDPTDIEVADLFAFLLESNEARRAVPRAEDLQDLLMRPLDTVAIENEINEYVARREDVDAELAELDDLSGTLPDLESRRQSLQSDLEELDAALEEKREALASADDSVEARRAEQSELDERMSDLEDARSDLTRTRQRLRTERSSIESLEDELADLEEELEGISDPPDADGDVEGELDRLRDRQDRLDTDITELQSIVQFNQKMVDGSSDQIVDALRGGASTPTDDLLPDEDRTHVCWTCGSEVEQTQLEETVEKLDDLRSEKLAERSEVRSRIDELQDLKRDLQQHRQRERRLEARIEDSEAEIADREGRVADLEDRREELEERVGDLEAAVRDLQTADQNELLELNREVNELEFEREQVDNDLEDLEAEIERVEARLEERPDLEERREEITDHLADLRTRIQRTEEEAVEQFNEHMERVLDILSYRNLDRVWIERKEARGESKFDIHVVRTAEDGTAYEDRLDHLSESEREVVGLVFALAGYLVHEVHETVPFLLLDSLEALDSDRLASLVEYFGDYADSLVVALLPEDAAAVSDEHPRISEF
ncbi:MAG: archaea-specific SMC-related protein [Haloarculaceae archaeon]